MAPARASSHVAGAVFGDLPECLDHDILALVVTSGEEAPHGQNGLPVRPRQTFRRSGPLGRRSDHPNRGTVQAVVTDETVHVAAHEVRIDPHFVVVAKPRRPFLDLTVGHVEGELELVDVPTPEWLYRWPDGVAEHDRKAAPGRIQVVKRHGEPDDVFEAERGRHLPHSNGAVAVRRAEDDILQAHP